jgi:hypothetical protein
VLQLYRALYFSVALGPVVSQSRPWIRTQHARFKSFPHPVSLGAGVCRSWGTSTPARRPCRPRGGLGVKRFFRLLPAALRFALHRPTAVVLGGTDSPYRAFGAWDGASCISILGASHWPRKATRFTVDSLFLFTAACWQNRRLLCFFFYYLGTMKSVVLIFFINYVWFVGLINFFIKIIK